MLRSLRDTISTLLYSSGQIWDNFVQYFLATFRMKLMRSLSLQGGLNEFRGRYNHLCAKPCPPPSKAPLYSPTTPIVHSEIDTAVASEILPFLYIGNERDAANRETLKELGITHVLNATSHLALHFENDGIIYKRLPASDNANQNLKQYFSDAFSFIDDARQSDERDGHIQVRQEPSLHHCPKFQLYGPASRVR